MRTDDELRAALKEHFWYHSIDLRPDVTTPGVANEHAVLPCLGIPDDLSGMTVLDIGCWDGFFSFECERRGASRVVASDLWENAGRGAFDFAREELDSKIEPAEVSVYDLDPDKLGRFDLVLFLGVLYHLKHPLLALEKIAACTNPGGLTIVDTVVDYKSLFDRPLMAFYPGSDVNADPTNWWGPNSSAMAMMLGSVGYVNVNNRIQLYGGNRGIFHAVKATDAECEELARREYRNRHRRPRK